MIDNREELERFRAEYEKNPHDRDAGVRLAQFYADLGWHNEAAEVYGRLSEQFGNDYELLLEYGNLQVKRENLQAAQELFRGLTGLKPERLEGWNNLGIVQLTLGDYDAARDSFARVLEIEPGNIGALLNMGNYYDQQGDVDRAISCFQQVTESRRDFADGWFNLGNAYIKAGRLQDAADCFERALKYAPEFGSAMKNLGFVREQLGENEQALHQYETALELNKADAGLYVNIANIHARERRFDAAKDFYLRAVRLAPKHPGGWMGLRRLSLAKGDIPTFVRSTLAVVHRLEEAVIADAVWRLRKLEHAARADDVLNLADRLGKQGDELDAERLLSYHRREIEPAKATAIYERLSGRSSLSDHIRTCLAEYAYDIGEKDAAFSYLEAVVDKGVIEQRMIWDLMLERNEPAQARELVERYLAEHNDCFEGWYYLARIEAAMDRQDIAREHLIRALENGFTDLGAIEAEPNLSKVYEELVSGDGRIL